MFDPQNIDRCHKFLTLCKYIIKQVMVLKGDLRYMVFYKSLS